MADTEFRTSPREPTFVKPLDTPSRRRSRASYDSAAASTRSWVLMTQQSPPPPVAPIPVPEPVPSLAPAPTPGSRPLPEPPRRTSAVLDESGAEHMAVELPADPVGYQWTTGRAAKAREARAQVAPKESKGFVGGFVSGLRRLPRALVRTKRPRRGTMNTEGTEEGTEGTRMTGNTLPQYASTPPTPVVAETGVVYTRGALGTPADNADMARRPRHPSFRVVPPPDDVQGTAALPIQCDPNERGEGHTILEFPQSPLENPYDREATSVPSPANPSPHLSRASGHLTPADPAGDEPASVQIHPLPTDDYRRMSAVDAAQAQSPTTINSAASFSADSPSFSTELNSPRRFLTALQVMPWVAPERITVDFQPRPKTKALVSWYRPEGEAESAPAERARALEIDAPRPTSPSNTPRTRSPPHHRTHRRAATSPSPPLPAAAPYGGYSFAAYYPAPSPPPTQTHTSRSRSRPRRHHHRRSATYPHPQQSPGPWVPPQLLPAPPAPVYIIQASPAPTASPPHAPHSTAGSVHATPGSAHATPGSSPRSDAHKPVGAQAQMLAPVYMQMQLMPGTGQLAFVPGPQPGESGTRYAGNPGYAGYGYGAGYGDRAGGGGNGYGYGYGYGSPIAMPAPVQTT
ncbi:hypothetical protein DFH06DRAFT_1321122 [Mycena polygramma]|nr:hypothetical protein DFH06DRAFT_1321122 [Mycena polygramma]